MGRKAADLREQKFGKLTAKYPLDRTAIEESLNRLTQTERDVLYMYLWDRHSMSSIARTVGFSDLRIEQILSKSHRKLMHYIASIMRK